MTARKNEICAYLARQQMILAKRVSEVDLMTRKYKSVRRIYGQIVAAAGRTLQRLFDNHGQRIPIPVRAITGRRRLDRRPSRD
jgi:hypothetical protein